ncbi:ribonuclease domain-containing protein [Acaricomes phytoseiuli]|uniref:ribonuclease domain-containing protein n=1 Tax=Acaricomes phytoseiuli TaxID=291968 RepID=UPI000362CBD0|nr:ribonuclease domain-containing protein [Acaricomes phytoseiuli]
MTNQIETSIAQKKRLAIIIAGALAVLVLFGSVLLMTGLGLGDGESSSTDTTSASSLQASGAASSSAQPSDVRNPSRLPEVKASELPEEAWKTLTLIAQDGPFPYDRDGINFGNFEGLLPKRQSGYYREYTVITPGASNRGARRIVAGQSGEKYYTSDHYSSFFFIQEGR